jgi:hypothetical protein
MSSWGNQDNVTIQGNVIVAVANGVNVLGIGTAFTSNIKSGDYITIASNKYQVNVISSDTVLTLTTAAATNTVGANAFVQQGPKYISNVVFSGRESNLYSIQKVFGVDILEIANTSPAANATTHVGWNHVNTLGSRVRVETLVAMSKNFNANATSDLQTDAADDSTYPQ